MRLYGANKATEFTKKQINVIYRLGKNGDLKIEKSEISRFYDLADYYGYDYNRSVEESEEIILQILRAVFDSDLETAQNLIDRDQKRVYNLLSVKNQQAWDSTIL